MARKWEDIPINTKLYENIDEGSLTRTLAGLENAFVNEAGSHTRFPGIDPWIELPDKGRVYLFGFRGSLMAGTSNGQLYEVDRNGNADRVSEVPVAGNGRMIFTDTADELIAAAGGAMVRYNGEKTELLSRDGPHTFFPGYIDTYVVAPERDSARFNHSEAGLSRDWPALNVYTAASKPDFITAMIITPYKEIIVAGPESTEQFERLTSGTAPFFNRWAIPEGIRAPYTMVFADNAVYMVNNLHEFVRISGQSSEPKSADIGRVLKNVDDWTDAWSGGYPDKPLNILGQNFIVLQMPHAATPYGTKGLTFAYDYKNAKWFSLYGWDEVNGVPTRWPVWSHWPIWDGTYVGGDNGKIGKISTTGHSNWGTVQRMVGRTAHLRNMGEIRVDNVRMTFKRGSGSNVADSLISLQCSRDDRNTSRWVRKNTGKAGDREATIEFGGFGTGHSFQFNWEITDDAPMEIMNLQAQITKLG